MQYFLNSYHEYLTTNVSLMTAAVILYTWLLLLVIVQIFIHEGGHCIFGFLTGYRFFSFRILNITLIRDNNRLRIKRYSMPGSFGQCLMSPPKDKGVDTPFILYILGGVIADMVTSIITAYLAFGPHIMPFLIRCCLMITSLYTLGSALINGIPTNKGKINTDGNNLAALIRDDQARLSGILQLSAGPLMQDGYTYTSFPEEFITVPEGADLANPLITWHKFMECYYLMELKQWDKALDCVNSIETSGSKKSKIVRITEASEKLFLYIKLGKAPSEIEGLYNEIKDILSRKGIDFNLTRVRMAFELYKDSSNQNKDRIHVEMDKKAADYPYKGEAKFCTLLMGEMLD